MIKHLLAIFLILLVKVLPAQGTATAMSSVTIVHPVGTEEIGEESLAALFASSAPTGSSSTEAFFADPAMKTGLTKFRVISHSFVYTIAVLPYTTENMTLQKREESGFFQLDVKSLRGAVQTDAYVLGTEASSVWPLQSLTEKQVLPDVVIHFN